MDQSKHNNGLPRVVEGTLALVGLILVAPVIAVSGLAVIVSSGAPILFRQQRVGRHGKQFNLYKLRTMRPSNGGPQITSGNDARITRLGSFFRHTKLDELPTLWNVVRGDMSLIGPRPHAMAHDNQYTNLVADYALRHHVKPGMTGWAQVNGFRGETAQLEQMKNRVALDLWYIDNWSVWLDLKILLSTCIEVMRRRNAF